MRLFEVIDSGKKFRRKEWDGDWYLVLDGITVRDDSGAVIYFDGFDLITEDWEIFND